MGGCQEGGDAIGRNPCQSWEVLGKAPSGAGPSQVGHHPQGSPGHSCALGDTGRRRCLHVRCTGSQKRSREPQAPPGAQDGAVGGHKPSLRPWGHLPPGTLQGLMCRDLAPLPNSQVSLNGALAVQEASDLHPAPQGTAGAHHQQMIEALPHKEAGRLSRGHLAHAPDAGHDLGPGQIQLQELQPLAPAAIPDLIPQAAQLLGQCAEYADS